MLRIPIVLARNIFAFLGFLWSTFWYNVEYLFRRKKTLYLTTELDSEYDFGPPSGLARFVQDDPSLLELRDRFERIAEAPSVDGLVVECENFEMGTAQIQSLTWMLDEVRESGTRVVAHLRSPTTADYLLGTAADDLLVSPSDRLQTFGPRFDQFFGARVADRLELYPQMIHIGDFKTAAHRIVHETMTVPQDAMMHQLHDTLVDQILGRVSRHRDTGGADPERLFERAPLDAREAARYGLVDQEVFRNRIEAWLRWGDAMAPTVRPPFDGLEEWAEEPPLEEEPVEPEDEPDMVDAEPEDVFVASLDEADSVLPPEYEWTPLFSREPRIAVVDLTGMIVMSGMGLPGGSGPVVDPDPLLPVLREIRESGLYDGLVVHINSPGGSAFASDIIWEALQQVRAIMPVVAYCTDVAASGGYYLAVAADHVVCHPTTMTGSIGVVTGKISAPDLVDRLGIGIDSIYDHDADTFTSPVHPLSDDMLERMGEGARSFYRRFLQRVGQNRDLPRRRLHRYARGRVYFGEDAERRNLVDELGSLDEVFDAVARMAGVDPDEAEPTFVPHRQQNLREMLGMQLSAESWLPEELTAPWAASKILEREKMLALMPVDVDWNR